MYNEKIKATPQTDIRDIIFKLIIQWKAVLLVCVIFAFIMTGMKYYKDITSYRAALLLEQEQQAMSLSEIDSKTNDILEGLGKDRAAVELILKQESWIEQERQYLNDSIYMQCEPGRVKSVKIVAFFTAQEGSYNYIFQQYKGFFMSDDFISGIKEIWGNDIGDSYIRELIKVRASEDESEQGIPTFILRVIIPDDVDAEQALEYVSGKMHECNAIVGAKNEHKMQIASADITVEVDEEMDDRKSKAITNFNNVQSALRTNRTSLSASQNAAYESIKKIQKSIKDNNSEEANRNISSADNKPRISKKYAIMGFVMGLITYALVLLLIMLYRNKIWSSKDAEYYTRTRLLGLIVYMEEHKGLQKLLHSRKLEMLIYNIDDTKIQNNKTIRTVQAVCSNNNVNKVTLFDFSETDSVSHDYISNIGENLEEKGIETNVVRGSDDIDEMIIANSNNSLLVLEFNRTNVRDLVYVMNLLSNYNNNCLGTICLHQL